MEIDIYSPTSFARFTSVENIGYIVNYLRDRETVTPQECFDICSINSLAERHSERDYKKQTLKQLFS